ncbi:type III-B CRISPR module-associated Cmr3 family protein [Nocardia sp. CA-119907]|uniref:type III-B CRISPR module-associated Cmr3 family protein n=1 Tax=Nocardia sp. CA-119907 TaxID=3239973 RepID=UPI003D99310D
MTPQRVLVTATLEQATALGKRSRGDYRNDSFDHIPGAVLRGACAAAWIRRHGAPTADDAVFAEIFDGAGTFGPLHSPQSLPLPLSIRTHKYRPTEDCTQLWWDQALGPQSTTCPDCHQDLQDSKGAAIGNTAVSVHVHAALDATGVAKDGSLFQTTALAAGTQLTGWVSGPAVTGLYDSHGQPIPRLKLGGGRSTAGGAILTVDPEATPQALEVRGDGAVILRLASAAVFVDDFGFPADRPAESELRAVLGCADAEIIQAWTRWTDIGGWHIASGLPKPVERAVAPGSTYLVRCPTPPEPTLLQQLHTRGLGLRRREGFGALFIAPPPPRPLGYWIKHTHAIREFPDWPKLQPYLRRRAASWPPERSGDERLLTAIAKVAAPEHTAALRHLLELSDLDLYTTVLDRLAAR